jgi:hypothetical protein
VIVGMSGHLMAHSSVTFLFCGAVRKETAKGNVVH